jgi:hypothetical protein
MCNIEPFPKEQKVMALSIVIKHVGWLDEVCLSGERWMSYILPSMELDPITLVDCIILPISWMEDVKLEEELAVQLA